MEKIPKNVQTALEMIQDGMVIGLGGGNTVARLVEALAAEGKQIQAVTPSVATLEICLKHGITMLPLDMTAKVDLAFDGCDEVDEEFNALKSRGGIHTREKIVAALADEYILFATEEKLHGKLEFTVPVAVEVIPAARQLVRKRLEGLGAKVTERTSAAKAGLAVSDDGNYLMDAEFAAPADSRELAMSLDSIPGLVEHSLFCGVVTGAIVAGADENVRVLRKK